MYFDLIADLASYRMHLISRAIRRLIFCSTRRKAASVSVTSCTCCNQSVLVVISTVKILDHFASDPTTKPSLDLMLNLLFQLIRGEYCREAVYL